jgi:hypothetical protein
LDLPSGGALRGCCGCGAAGVLVAELHLPDLLRPADLSYNNASPIERSLFLSELLSIFLELLHVCLRRND